VETRPRFIEQPQNDTLAQRRHVDHVPNRRADQHADRFGFSSYAWLPDLATSSEVADGMVLAHHPVLATDPMPAKVSLEGLDH
jgi:hypothetical protein